MTGKYSAYLRVRLLWGLTFAVILCAGFALPVRASGTFDEGASFSEGTFDGDGTPAPVPPDGVTFDGDGTPAPMPPDIATFDGDGTPALAPPDGVTFDGDGTPAPMPPDGVTPSINVAQAPPTLPGGGVPPGGGMLPPGGPPSASTETSLNDSYGPSKVTLESFLTLTTNVLILCCGIAFALRYHRGRKSF